MNYLKVTESTFNEIIQSNIGKMRGNIIHTMKHYSSSTIMTISAKVHVGNKGLH